MSRALVTAAVHSSNVAPFIALDKRLHLRKRVRKRQKKGPTPVVTQPAWPGKPAPVMARFLQLTLGAMSKPPPPRASSITPPPTEAVEPPKRVTAVLVALTLGHLRVAEEQLLVHPSSLDGERGLTRTAFLALADARREIERAREAQHCLNQVRSGRE